MFMWLFVFTVLSNNLQVESLSYDPGIFKCHPGFCENVKCEQPTNCKGLLEPKSSFCQCCDVCIKLLGEGEKCHEPLSGSLKEISTEKCQAGLICSNGVCQKVNTLTGCLKLKHVRENLIPDPNSTYADQIWIPDCMTNGDFRAKQQKKRKSICVDALGETIFGQLPPGLSENMTCECSRYMIHLEKEHPNTFMTRPQEHCSPSGDFGDLQCIGGLCYCADQETGEVQDRIVTRNNMDKLPCYDKDTHDSGYLKECESELQRARSVRFGFFEKGVNVFGLERFKCDPDGSYSPVQSDSEEYVCTNKDGTRIGSFHYEIDVVEALSTKMTCNCARDSKGTDTEYQYPTMRCEGWGNYKLFQCFHNNQCFCVDQDGDTISKQLTKDSANQSVCLGLLNEVSGKSGDLVVTTLLPTSTSETAKTDDVTSDEYVYDDD